MNCSQHPEVAAVASCAQCGVGMCPDCLNASEFAIDNKPICRQCNYQMCATLLAEDQKKRGWTIFKIALGALSVLIAAGVLASGGGIENIVILLALGALPTAFRIMFHSTAESRLHSAMNYHAAEIKGDSGDGCIVMVLSGIFKFILAILIAAVASPILLIVNIFKLVKLNKEIAENEELLANFTA